MHAKIYFSSPGKKRDYNRHLFDIIAPYYDNCTRILSLCGDREWKRFLVSTLPYRYNPTYIDFACGTGDITELLSKKYPLGRGIGADIAPSMLERARARMNRCSNVTFILSDMGASPFHNESADIVTGGYSLRNAPDLHFFLSEVFRILRPGGCAGFLDFSRFDSSVAFRAQFGILWCWGAFWGWTMHRNPAMYTYIAESLAVFPSRCRLERLIREAGFIAVSTRTFYFGAIAVISFCKPSI